MPELLIELLSEEIPAGMQEAAAASLSRLAGEALSALSPRDIATYAGPRRIALSAQLDPELAGRTSQERGPREGAPEAALAGFLRKHEATPAEVRLEGGFWVLERRHEAVPAASLLKSAMPGLLRRVPWPKSMRWSPTSAFTWVRPLRRILCILDGQPVRFSLASGDDDGHGLISANVSEGHRLLSPGPFTVTSVAGWKQQLRTRHVLVSAADRATLIREGTAGLAAEQGLELAADPGLVDEVSGLVEWPVPMLGRIDDSYMDLPPEVMQVSMRVNQRYFALRHPDGRAAPHFAFVANCIPADGGRLTIAGNERVLRARFSDARHFWDLDRATPLADRRIGLYDVTFQAALGSQGERADRIARLAVWLAPHVGAEAALAERAARLAKADLLTGMVGEFPELQGVMGGYYAAHDGEPPEVAAAIREHYLPKGAADRTPTAPVSVAVALADRLDSLAGFFAAGEKPGGSGDPYALRRAALGVIRIVRAGALRLDLHEALRFAAAGLPEALRDAPDLALLPSFVAERLRVQLRGEGARHDVLAAVAAIGPDGDLVRLLARTQAVAALLLSDDGRDLLAAGKRAVGILRIEEKKDGATDPHPDPALYRQDEERMLDRALAQAAAAIGPALDDERFEAAMGEMAGLRGPLDRFFDAVTVNADDPLLRRNRLRLLAAVRATLGRAADFNLIEG